MTSFTSFLTAKRTIEDRAINRVVWDRFVDALADSTVADHPIDEPVRIVEIGVGTGSMLARLVEWNALPPKVSYRAIDIDSETLAVARRRLPEKLRDAGYSVETTDSGFEATRTESNTPTQTLAVTFETGDGFEQTDKADAVIASAVLDLVDLPEAVDQLQNLLVDDGVLYAPFTFNGHTSFQPAAPADETIERLYHRHMDEIRDQPGSSRAGQQLLTALPVAGYTVLDAGGADWIIRPRDGTYPHDESTVLSFLLSTIDTALADYPEETLSVEQRRQWIETRYEQLDDGALTLVAHHMDVLARLG